MIKKEKKNNQEKKGIGKGDPNWANVGDGMPKRCRGSERVNCHTAG